MAPVRLLVLPLLFVACAAWAGKTRIENVQTYVTDQQALRASVLDGKYKRLPEPEKAKITAAQDRIFAALEGKTDLDQLDAAERRQVLADQAVIDQVLAQAQDLTGERMVCKRHKQLGSNFHTRTCRTELEWEQIAERSREQLENSTNNVQMRR